jgi:uncharacterized repeat protein (TIGR03806 family)
MVGHARRTTMKNNRSANWNHSAGAVLFALSFVVTQPIAKSDDRATSGNRQAPARFDGLAHRPPWTSSKFSGTPDPPTPYSVELAFPHLKFENPAVLVSARGTNRLFLGDLRGRIWSFPNEPGCKKADLAFETAKLHPDLTAFYGLTFHTDFERNRYVYLCYVRKNDIPDGSVVARFTISRTDPPVIDPASEQVILTFWSGGHNGGCLEFGTDSYLYISTGDGAGPAPPDPKMTGQDCSDLLSSILRIDVDHPEPGKAYRVPADNPFVGTPGVRPEIWAFGFRNPWKMSFDRSTGALWLGDVGWELWEMVYRVQRGGNYGWSVMEGPQPVHAEAQRGPGPILPPLKAHPHSEAASITGGFVYHGKRLPELAGAYIYGDYQTGIIWGLRAQGNSIVWQRELARTPLHLVAFGEAGDGELFLVDHDRTHQIYRLIPNQPANRASSFPRKLSETGLLASTREHQLAPGVVAYEINAPLWSDGATAERMLAVPGAGRIAIDGQGIWHFPEGSVLARTVYRRDETGPGAGSGRRRIETQVLHLESDAWRPYTYVWNADQSDAFLADAGGAAPNAVASTPSHRVHARAECLLCHNPWVEKKTTGFGIQSASPLGISTAQLNRPHEYGGTKANQLTALHEMGLLAEALDPAKSPAFADPYDESAAPERRARSYLHANCSHCHQFNAGGTANIALAFDIPLDQTRTVGVRPIQGTFQIAGAQIIAPGDLASSVLYYRIAKLGGGRMPRLGSTQVDERACRMIADWIARMPAAKGSAEPLLAQDRAAIETVKRREGVPDERRLAATRHLLSTTRGALQLIAEIDRGRVPASVGRSAANSARDAGTVEVRDLFERFLPTNERVERLGDRFDRAAVLALSGDAARGRQIFLTNPAVQCKNCHKAEGAGQEVGPDLKAAAAKYKYDKAALLDHIVDPSRTIDPPYVAHALALKDGRILTGVLVERTAEAVVIKDAQGKTIRVASADVERTAQQAQSLMPDLLLRDLTAQQAADLLEFLASLR